MEVDTVVHFNLVYKARQTAEVLQIFPLKWNRVQLSGHANLIKVAIVQPDNSVYVCVRTCVCAGVHAMLSTHFVKLYEEREKSESNLGLFKDTLLFSLMLKCVSC